MNTLRMRHMAAGLVLCLFALAGEAATYERAIDVAFPDEVGGLALVGREAFPSKELGVGLTYERGRLRGSVFIYDGGMPSLPAGTDSTVVRAHFAQVVDEVKRMEASGQYRSVSFVGPAVQATRYTGCGPQFLAREFLMVTREGIERPSFAYLTVVNGNFVKLRVSYMATGSHSREDVERFVTQLRKLLGRCPA